MAGRQSARIDPDRWSNPDGPTFIKSLQPRYEIPNAPPKPRPYDPNWTLSFEDRGLGTQQDPVSQGVDTFRRLVGENYGKPAGEFGRGFFVDDPLFDEPEPGEDVSNWRKGGMIAATVPVFGMARRGVGAGRRIVGDAIAQMEHKLAKGQLIPEAAAKVERALMHAGTPELERAIQHGGTANWRSIEDAALNDPTGVRTRNVGNLIDEAGGRVSSEMRTLPDIDELAPFGPDLPSSWGNTPAPPPPMGATDIANARVGAAGALRRRGIQTADLPEVQGAIGDETAREVAGASGLSNTAEAALARKVENRVANAGGMQIVQPGPVQMPGRAAADAHLQQQVDFLKQQGMNTDDAQMLIAQQGTPNAMAPQPLPAGIPQFGQAPAVQHGRQDQLQRQIDHAINLMVQIGIDPADARRMIMAQRQAVGAPIPPAMASAGIQIPTPAQVQQFGQAPAVHVRDPLQTSQRVEDARAALEARGVGTETARRAVPRGGTDAFEFQRAVESLNPIQQGLPPGQVPTIAELIGEPFSSIGRPADILGASPKRVLVTPTGKKFMHKGQPHTRGGNDTAGIAASARANPDDIAREEAASRVSRTMNDLTPIAHEVQEGGSVQRLVEDRWDLPTLRSLMGGLTDAQIKQLQKEEVVDVMLRNSDNHMNQFFMTPGGVIVPADKGLAQFGRRLTSDVGQAGHPFSKPYRHYYRGQPLSGRADPNVPQEYIQSKIKGGTTEQQYRESLTPWFKNRGMSDADVDTFMRSWMRDIDKLPGLFDTHYRTNVR